MQIKMIVCDLDGTLLDSHNPNFEMPIPLIEEIQNYMDKGGIFTLATGRPAATTLPVAEMLNLKWPLITQNGAQIVETSGREVFSTKLFLSDLYPFMKKIPDSLITAVFTYECEVYCLKRTNLIKAYEAKENIVCKVASIKILNSGIKIYKLLLIGNVALFQEKWNTMPYDFRSKFSYVLSEDNYMEIMQHNVSKGSALKFLKAHLGIEDDQVLAIGNHMNDFELLEEAHIGVAVGNAVEELKSNADIVTCQHYSYGVLETMQNL